MLVLDRKLHEGIWIDGRIFVKVLAVGQHRVKLGVEAPADLSVVREELREGWRMHAPDERNGRSTREQA
jgi:carbon storage regulator CsrA